MEHFLREKDIEAYLVEETRFLTLPGDVRQPVTVFRLCWVQYESLINTLVFTADELLAMTRDMAADGDESFSACFSAVVGYAFNAVKQQRFGS